MKSDDKAQIESHRNRRRGLIAAGIALVVIIGAVVLVLALAGGNTTKDGTGRDQVSSTTATSYTTNTAGGAGSGSDR